jgi:hypothetical protein
MSLTSGLDMKFGHDLRGDYALFIDKKRLKNDCFDEETTELLKKIKDGDNLWQIF